MRLNYIFGILIALCFSSSAFSGQNDNITVAQLIKMPLKERLEVCSALVDSESLGSCININNEPSQSAMMDSAKLEKEMYHCANELGKVNPVDAVSCARNRLDKTTMNNDGKILFNDAQMKAATALCAAHVESKKIAKCVSVVAMHVDAQGGIK